MSTFKTIDEAREYFKGDRFATENGMVIDELGEDYALCSMTLTDSHRNAAGGVMGGVMFTLADFAFAVASNNRHNVTVAIACTINFMSGVKGDKLFALAKCVKDGRTTCVYDIEITDSEDRDIAKFTGTGYKHLK